MEHLLEFFLIIVLQGIGVFFQVMKKVKELDKICPDDALADVFRMFWKEDRVTVFMSVGILALDLVVHLIIVVYAPAVRDTAVPIPASNLFSFLPDFSIPYLIISFVIALFLGYAGQAFMYRLFGKLEKKVTENLNLDH